MPSAHVQFLPLICTEDTEKIKAISDHGDLEVHSGEWPSVGMGKTETASGTYAQNHWVNANQELS